MEKQTINQKSFPSLLNHQKEHYQRLVNILKHSYGYLDTSDTGCGKTYTTCMIAKQFGMSILVVSPLTILSHWRKVTKEFGINLIDALSYASLRGSRGSTLNHPYLIRSNNKYSTTDPFDQLIKKGTLLVFDEVHNLKNLNTLQREAALTMVRKIVEMNHCSRVALLSAYSFDKSNLCESIILLLGLTNQSNLFYYDRHVRIHIRTGINDVTKLCKRLDFKLFNSISSTPIKKYPFELYSQILKYYYTSSMLKPEMNISIDIKNGFYIMDDQDVIDIQDAQNKFNKLMRMNNGKYILGKNNMGIITQFLMRVEKAKIPTMIRLSKEILMNPNAKLILYVWYKKQSIPSLIEGLKDYKPQILNGDTKVKDRDTIIDSFQSPDGPNNCRLIISHPIVGGVGISLDDRDGKYPRTILMIPNYHHISTHQTVGRIYRVSTKSTPTVRFIYSKDCDEHFILDALSRKCDTVKDSLYQVDERIKYPGEYDKYIES